MFVYKLHESQFTKQCFLLRNLSDNRKIEPDNPVVSHATALSDSPQEFRRMKEFRNIWVERRSSFARSLEEYIENAS